MPVTFVVFVLSGTMLLLSGSLENIGTDHPFDTLELCQAFAEKLPTLIAARGDVRDASWECRPHELPIPPANSEKLVPQQDAG